VSEPSGVVCPIAIPDTVKISAALIAPVAVIVVAFVAMLLVLVAATPDTSRMSAALIAPVAVMLAAFVSVTPDT
jgi:hypothetical protein